MAGEDEPGPQQTSALRAGEGQILLRGFVTGLGVRAEARSSTRLMRKPPSAPSTRLLEAVKK
ncbi:hypothetical protein ACFV94_04935 [Streptomyces sp. NPDC059896]|uniref:hypothetical protein n=1 Tax=Streptomyces sp. NPDC059896 TaxID=3346993 RepID=UPI00364C7F28